MVQKEHLRIKNMLIAASLVLLISCSNKNTEEVEKTSLVFVDTDTISYDTVLSTVSGLTLNNGIYYLKGQAYSGYIKREYPGVGTESINGILNGMLHGRSVSYYEGGQTREVRMYRQNKSFGRSYGFWEDGKMKFEYYYLDDKREGSNKQWYKGGTPYAFLNFKDDKEEGLQQAWRENGKPYINYEVRDGFRYGLQKSNLCYTLVGEKFKSK